MTYYAINGSPRKTHNTATILNKALEGVKAADPQAQTELIHLYSHDFSGCVSCFECKRLGGKSYGKCAVRDGLTPILERLADADGIIFGSPVYFHSITGKMRMFFERLLFQYFVYDADYSALSPKRMPTAFVYTMNVPYQVMLESHYTESFQSMESFIQRVFSKPEPLFVNDTYQFSDYSKYKADRFSETDKARHREQQFPIDCQKQRRRAFSLTMNCIQFFFGNRHSLVLDHKVLTAYQHTSTLKSRNNAMRHHIFHFCMALTMF